MVSVTCPLRNTPPPNFVKSWLISLFLTLEESIEDHMTCSIYVDENQATQTPFWLPYEATPLHQRKFSPFSTRDVLSLFHTLLILGRIHQHDTSTSYGPFHLFTLKRMQRVHCKITKPREVVSSSFTPFVLLEDSDYHLQIQAKALYLRSFFKPKMVRSHFIAYYPAYFTRQLSNVCADNLRSRYIPKSSLIISITSPRQSSSS